jgi:hypothetical protein
MAKGRVIKAKGKCCKSGPRCKRCPVACKRLERESLAERISKRRYLIDAAVTKRQWKVARAR